LQNPARLHGQRNLWSIEKKKQALLMRRAAIFFATRREISRFSACGSVSEKDSIQMITLITLSRLIQMNAKLRNQKKGTTMNPLTQLKKYEFYHFSYWRSSSDGRGRGMPPTYRRHR
jgi:hypothetical protein